MQRHKLKNLTFGSDIASAKDPQYFYDTIGSGVGEGQNSCLERCDNDL